MIRLMRRSRFTILGEVATLAIAAVLVSVPAGAQEVQFWHYQTFGNQTALRQMLDGFEKETGLKVRDTAKPPADLYAAAMVAAGVGRGPDIMQVFTRNIPALVTQMNGVPLTADPASREWLKNFLPSFLHMGTYNSTIYGVPHATGTPLMYYNKDLFKRAGLDPAKPPRTWAEVIEASRTLQAKTGKAGITVVHDALDFGANTMLMSNQAKMLSDDGKRVAFDDARGIEAMQTWQDLVVKHKVHPLGEANSMRSAFEAGEIGIRIDTSATLGRHIRGAKGKFELGVAQFPTWGDRPRSVPNSGSVVVVFAPEGQRRTNAFRLMAYMSRPAVSNEWSSVTGYMPVSADPLADPKMVEFYKQNPEYLPIVNQMKDTVPMVVWPAQHAGEIAIRMKNLVDDIWVNKAPAPDLVRATVDGINRLMAGGK